MKFAPPSLRRGGFAVALAFFVAWPFIGVPSASAAPVTAVSSTPIDGAVLPTSPLAITITFDQTVGSASSVVITCNGNAVVQPGARPTEDLRSLVVDLTTSPLPRGSCVVGWQVQGLVDAGTSSGTFAFTIQQDTVAAPATPQSTVAGQPAPPVTIPADPGAPADPPKVGGVLGLARILTMLALAALFGALVLISVAWPEGVEYVLTIRFLRYAWLAGLIGALLTVICMTAQATGDSFTSSISPTNWFELVKSGPGVAAVARLALIAGTAWVVVRPERLLDPATQLMSLAVPALAVATLGFSRSGGSLELLGYAAGIVHALGMAVWLGGLMLLSRVVLSGPGDDDLVHAVRGFSRLVTPAWIATLVTGLIQMYRLDRGHLLGSTHGRLLILKVIVVALMVFAAVAAKQFIMARLTRADVLSVNTAGSLRRAVSMEAIAGVVVLALTAWMVSSMPATLNVSKLSVGGYAYQQRFVDPTSKLDLKLYLSPAKVGRNEALVQLVKPSKEVSQMTIRFDPPITSFASPIILTVPLSVAGVAHLGADIGLPFNVAGAWTVTVDVVATAGTFRQSAVLNVLSDSTNPVTVSIPTVSQPIVTSPPGVGPAIATTTLVPPAVTSTTTVVSG